MLVLFTYNFEDNDNLEVCLDALYQEFGGRGVGGYSNYMSSEIDIDENCPNVERACEICEEYGVLYKEQGRLAG